MKKSCMLPCLFLGLLSTRGIYAIDREIFQDDMGYSFGKDVCFTRQPVSVETRSGFQITLPYKPSQEAQQRVLHYEGNPLALDRGEQIPPSSVFVKGRKQVQNTTEWPYSPHGHLDLFFGDHRYGGSGILIGQRHVLTCAHNVYIPEKKAWVTRMSFYPGLNDSMGPFGVVDVIAIYVKQAWVTSAEASADMALLILAEPIGRLVGHYGLACIEDDNFLLKETVAITGYPGDKGARQMWTMSNPLKMIHPDQFEYMIDTYAGQSGSAIWIDGSTGPLVIGVHTRGGSTSNSGVRLSLDKFSWLVTCMSETGEYQGPPNTDTETSHSKVQSEDPQDADAQFNLGKMYENGQGVSKDDVKAFEWYKKAAGQGHVSAQWYLGIMYENGQGVSKDDAKAYEWHEKAANQGHDFAQVALGKMYENGTGVPENIAKAHEWYQKAADQGNAYAQYEFGLMYEEWKNDTRACGWYRMAANQGHDDAQYKLGVMYTEGRGIDKNEVKACEWYRRAAKQGHVEAQYKLGMMYENGRGIDKNDVKACEWYRKAAEQEHVEAQYRLGMMHAEGRGVDKNEVEACEWYSKASNQGHFKASKLFRLASIQRSVEAQKLLGEAQKEEKELSLTLASMENHSPRKRLKFKVVFKNRFRVL